MKEFVNEKGEIFKSNNYYIIDLKTDLKKEDIFSTNGFVGIYSFVNFKGESFNKKKSFYLLEKVAKSPLVKNPKTTLINESLETISLAPEVIYHTDERTEMTGYKKNNLGRFMMIEQYEKNGKKWSNEQALDFYIFTKEEPNIKTPEKIVKKKIEEAIINNEVESQIEEKENSWNEKKEIYDIEIETTHEEITKNLTSLAENTNVNNPSHYGGKGNVYEVINILEHYEMGFDLGNAIKYIIRAGKKDPEKKIEDLKKAQWYLNRNILNEIAARENKNEKEN